MMICSKCSNGFDTKDPDSKPDEERLVDRLKDGRELIEPYPLCAECAKERK